MTVIPAGALIRNREAPELGSGRILSELEGGSARVVFENSEEVREVRIAHTDIVRQPLIPGTRVQVQKGEKVSQAEIVGVNWPKTPQDLCGYIVRSHGMEEELLESQISPLPPASNSPIDELGALHWRGPFRFFSRWDMHRTIAGWYEDSEGLPSAIGARIEPQLHHAHALRRVLWDGTRRYFLADEDPQARLYEAGMAYQRMCAADAELRVLVIAPGRRTHRWQTELELRFGNREFVRIDATHLALNPAERWASVSQNQRLIVSMTCFQQYPQACDELILGDVWDLIIIDEVHRLRPQDPVYSCLKESTGRVANVLLLGALPERADARAWEPILSILHADSAEDEQAASMGREEIDARIAELSGVWKATLEGTRLLQAAEDGEELDSAGAAGIADELEGLLADDAFVVEKAAEVREADVDALAELVGYLKRYYRLERRVVRSRREHLARYDVNWSERSVETLNYSPDPSEQALIEHLDSLAPASPADPMQMALRGLYFQAAAGTPERFFALLEERLDALDTTAGKEHQDLAVFDVLDVDMGPREERMFREKVIAGAASLDDEIVWIVEAMSMVGQWHAESVEGCARFQAAGDWVQARLAQGKAGGGDEAEEQDERKSLASPKIVVACTEAQTARDATTYLESRFGAQAVEMIHSGMQFDEQNEVVERFQRERECRLLVCDETGAQGRDLTLADVVLHLTQPWSSTRVDRRISQVDAAHRSLESTVHSVVMVGPSRHERALHRLYDEELDIFASAPATHEYAMGEIDLRIGRAACGGPEELEEVVQDLAAGFATGGAPSDVDEAYRVAFDPSDVQLEEDAEFCDLLEFIDGIADSLPIRHWARMLGIQDHSSGPGAFDFKWHWSNVRRPLAGFVVGPEDVDLLLPQEQVEMMTGTFSRKRALRSENLEFFGPGHRFIDALVEDAMRGNALPAPGFGGVVALPTYQEPQDGRSTIFARRLGPEHRGKVFVNVVAAARLDRSAWENLDMPQGLINRAYRHLWPESLSVPVEIDLKGRREPKVVTNRELIQKIEGSYQGPEADQKLEYEIFIQAIEDVARFRGILDRAVELAVASLKEDREGLVDGAAAELSDDVAAEMAFLRAQAARGGESSAGEAARELELYEKIIESVRRETLEIDALAIVIAGTPQVLMR
jgi:hypothetical protein